MPKESVVTKNGYKVDIRANPGTDSFITKSKQFTDIGLRSDGHECTKQPMAQFMRVKAITGMFWLVARMLKYF
jgi:hypothetical protein